jgi:hypothetical protein
VEATTVDFEKLDLVLATEATTRLAVDFVVQPRGFAE